MSYEIFRADFASRVLPLLPDESILPEIMHVLDQSAANYDFVTRCTDLIVTDGLPEIVRLYIATKSISNIKKGTLDNYYSLLKIFFQTVKKPLDQITATDIRLFLAWYKNTRKVKDSTLDGKRIILHSFFEWCVDEDQLRRNPMRHVDPIRVADPERLPMTAVELETVRKSCKTLREKALVDFLYSTAARVSEVCAMDISDVNFREHTVHIRHGKGDKGRTTFLNAESEVSLMAYLYSRKDNSPVLFAPVRGEVKHLNKKTIEEEIRRIVSRCEISVHVTPHIFRHTAASLALQRGMPIEQVQKFLGHARIQTTLRYAKVLDFEVKLNHQKYVA